MHLLAYNLCGIRRIPHCCKPPLYKYIYNFSFVLTANFTVAGLAHIFNSDHQEPMWSYFYDFFDLEVKTYQQQNMLLHEVVSALLVRFSSRAELLLVKHAVGKLGKPDNLLIL